MHPSMTFIFFNLEWTILFNIGNIRRVLKLKRPKPVNVLNHILASKFQVLKNNIISLFYACACWSVLIWRLGWLFGLSLKTHSKGCEFCCRQLQPNEEHDTGGPVRLYNEADLSCCHRKYHQTALNYRSPSLLASPHHVWHVSKITLHV